MAAATVPTFPTDFHTIREAQERVGDVPDHRILSFPAPGTATANDLLDPKITRGRGVELVDGILVEKPMGAHEEGIAMRLANLIFNFAAASNLGMVFGSQGPFRFQSGLIRYPDVSFVRWDSTEHPDEIENPPSPFVDIPPDLVVEVLSESNTPREMEIKLGEYAAAGVKLVWYVDPDAKSVTVYPKGRERGKKVLGVDDTLDGGKVLPGFALPVADIFAPRAPKTTKKKGKK
jgi:Uma2 family endonuclease